MSAHKQSVLFLSPEPVGTGATGPARRTVKLAEMVAAECHVTLAAPRPSIFPDGPFRTIETGPTENQQLASEMAAHDITVLQVLPSPRQLLTALRKARRLVVDVIAPLALEAAELNGSATRRRRMVHWRTRQLIAHLAAADLVLCTNERQRDLLTGVALASGLLVDDPSDGTSLHDRIEVVPHGLDPSPPGAGRSRLRADGTVGKRDRLAIWGGGMWSWLDPLTAVRAVDKLRVTRTDLKLAFVGYEHPDPLTRDAHEGLAAQARAYVDRRGLSDTVVFRPEWLARDDYLRHLSDADVGLSLHGRTLEGRYASRTRVLDYVSAGLPVVCSSGDTMATFIAANALGTVIEPLDVDGCAAALDALTRGESRPTGSAELAPLVWEHVARPLVEYCAGPGAVSRRHAGGTLGLVARSYPAFVAAVYAAGGPVELGRGAQRAAGRVLRPRASC